MMSDAAYKKEDEMNIPEDDLFVPAQYNQENAEKISYSNYSYWRSTFKTFTKNKLAVVLLFVIVIIALFSLIQPLLPGQYPYDTSPNLANDEYWKMPPNSEFWFGTDAIGRDMWARVWAGTRISLSLAVFVAVSETILGIIIGAFWGYIRQIDRVMTEVYNVISNIPGLVLYMLMAYVMTPSYWTIVIVMISTGWLSMARYIRNMVTIIRDREYNLASRSLGTPVIRMLFRNIIPYLISVILMRLAIAIPSIISLEIILSYLNVGLPITTPSLGVMTNTGQQVFMQYPHLLVYPVLIVSIITVSFYVVGNAFSDASDPRNHT